LVQFFIHQSLFCTFITEVAEDSTFIQGYLDLLNFTYIVPFNSIFIHQTSFNKAYPQLGPMYAHLCSLQSLIQEHLDNLQLSSVKKKNVATESEKFFYLLEEFTQ